MTTRVFSNFQIRTIDFITGLENSVNEVSVRFDSNEANGEYLNGSVKLTFAEYQENSRIEKLTEIVKTKVQEKFAVTVSTV